VNRPGASTPDDATGVFYLYGVTMHAVQSFERNLATLAVLLTRKRRNKPLTTQRATRAVQQAMDRSLDALQRSSAKALLNKLPRDFDPDLRDEIGRMIEWRDRLAHRYLVERIVHDTTRPHRFQPGTAEELMRLGKDFATLAGKLKVRLDAAVAELPEADSPEGFREFIEGWVQAAMSGEPWEPELRE
jgi:hypothetical protein